MLSLRVKQTPEGILIRDIFNVDAPEMGIQVLAEDWDGDARNALRDKGSDGVSVVCADIVRTFLRKSERPDNADRPWWVTLFARDLEDRIEFVLLGFDDPEKPDFLYGPPVDDA